MAILVFLGSLVEPGWRAFQTYRPVFLGIQGAAALFLGLYFLVPDVRTACDGAAAWKESSGWWFGVVMAVVSGAAVPELLKWKMRPPGLPRPTVLELAHQFSLFAILGAMVDQFYQLQMAWFGATRGLGVLLLKIFIDQFIYSLLLTAPLSVVWFLWREQGYRPLATWAALRPSLLRERVLPMWATGLVFWIPLLLGLYLLPVGLQFVAFLFANCAWGILLIFIARRQIDHARVVQNIPGGLERSP